VKCGWKLGSVSKEIEKLQQSAPKKKKESEAKGGWGCEAKGTGNRPEKL